MVTYEMFWQSRLPCEDKVWEGEGSDSRDVKEASVLEHVAGSVRRMFI